MGSVPSPALGVSGDALAAELRRRLRNLGFDTVRFAVPAELPAAGALRAWLAQGMHADMAWMERSARPLPRWSPTASGVSVSTATALNSLGMRSRVGCWRSTMLWRRIVGVPARRPKLRVPTPVAT